MNKAQRSFAKGEIAPALHARTDTAAYDVGLRTCRNFMVMRQGGATKRPGTEYIGNIRDITKHGRLIPFVFNVRDSLVLEFGYHSIRFLQNGAFIADPDDDTLVYEIASPYTEDELPELQYVQSGDVVTIVHPSYPPYELKRLANNDWTLTAITFGATIAAPTSVVTAGGSLHESRTVQYIVTAIDEFGEESLASNVATNATPPGNIPIVVNGNCPGAVTFNVYRSDLNSGVYGFVGSGVVTDDLVSFADYGTLPDYTIQPPIEKLPFGAVGDYPSVVAYYQQRLVFANTNNHPDTVWCSRTGHFHNFNVSAIVQDDDAITFRLVSDEVDAVRHILTVGRMIVGTEGVAWIVEGGADGVITPIAINARAASYDGMSNLKPVKIGERMLFVQALGGVVRELRANVQFGSYSFAGGDLTIFSSHLVDGYTITDWAFQQEPAHTLWAVRSDGVLLSLTYIPDQEMLGWARHDTKGFIENVCVVPEGKSHWVYWIVRRLINGSYRRYIERQTVSAIVPVFATADEIAGTPGGIITPPPPPPPPPPSGGPLSPPTNARTTGIGTVGATANWDLGNPLAPVELSFRVRGAPDWQTSTLPGGVTSFPFVGLTPGVAYEWRVRHVLGTDSSAYLQPPTDGTQFTTLAATLTLDAPPSAPVVSDTVVLTGETRLVITWTPSDTATSTLQIAGPAASEPSDGAFSTISSFEPGVGSAVWPVFATGTYWLRVRYERAAYNPSAWAGPSSQAVSVTNESGTPGAGGGGEFASPAEFPRYFGDARWSTPVITGLSFTCTTMADVQTAFDTIAASGNPNQNHKVVCTAGALTFNTHLIERVLPSGSGKVYVGPPSMFDGSFPRTATQYLRGTVETQGQRIRYADSYEQMGGSSPLVQFRTPDGQPVLVCEPAAGRYVYQGIEFAPTVGNTGNLIYALVDTMDEYLGILPPAPVTDASHSPTDHQFRHCIFRANLTGSEVRRGLYEGYKTITADCAFYRIRVHGAESAGIASWNSRGSNMQVNVFFDCGAQSILYGGSGPVATLSLGDNHTKWCHSSKDPNVSGVSRKNHFEAKNCVRWLIEDCIEEHNVTEGQTGGNNVFQTLDDDNFIPPQQVVSDIIFNRVVVIGGGAAFILTGRAAYGAMVWPNTPSHRIHIRNVYCRNICGSLAEAAGSTGYMFQFDTGVKDVLIEKFTGEARGLGFAFTGRQTVNGVETPAAENLEIRDSLLGKGFFAAFGDTTGTVGTGSATLVHDVDGVRAVHNNVFYNPSGAPEDSGLNPIGNYYVTGSAVGFAAYVGQDPGALGSSSPYKGAATDGSDIGCDYTTLMAMETAVRETSLPW